MQIDLSPDWSLLVIMLIFWVNYWVVRKFFLQPINKIVEERAHDIRSGEERYEEALARFDEATADMESKLHHARREGSLVRERSRAEAMTHRASLVEKTRGEADKIVASADEQLKRDVTVARDTIVTESEALARLAAEHIMGRKLA
ncbi:MAG TPA: hypothetical protein VIL97_03150 [Thermoanaerobaculia bacterium]